MSFLSTHPVAGIVGPRRPVSATGAGDLVAGLPGCERRTTADSPIVPAAGRVRIARTRAAALARRHGGGRGEDHAALRGRQGSGGLHVVIQTHWSPCGRRWSPAPGSSAEARPRPADETRSHQGPPRRAPQVRSRERPRAAPGAEDLGAVEGDNRRARRRRPSGSGRGSRPAAGSGHRDTTVAAPLPRHHARRAGGRSPEGSATG
jgi:hypothetical protein